MPVVAPVRRPAVRRAALGLLLAPLLLTGCVGGGDTPPAPSPVPSTPSASPTPVDPVAAEIDERLAKMDLATKAATVLMLHTPGTDPSDLASYMTTTGAGGFILMGDNVPSTAASVQPITAAIKATSSDLPPLIGIDEEGGDVARLDDDTFPAAATLKNEPAENTRSAFASRGQLVNTAGANLNFGVIADMTSDPDSFIFDRVFGGDPTSAGDRVEQAVLGERGLALSTLKHFPGHGRSEANSHNSIPVTDVSQAEWSTTDAVPFERGIGAGAEAVMTGHLLYSSVDPDIATFSTKWHDILRNDMGFDGLVVTDDMLMLLNSGQDEYADPVANAVRALGAGGDLLLHVLAHDDATSGVSPDQLKNGIVAAVQNGQLSQDRLDDAVRHVLEARILARDE